MHWRWKWQPTPVFLPRESRDGGAWWAAVSGVAQSQTRLKRLSSMMIHIHHYSITEHLHSPKNLGSVYYSLHFPTNTWSLSVHSFIFSRPSYSWNYIVCSFFRGEGNGTPSSTLAWKIPWMEEPGGLQSMGSLRVRHDWATSLSLFTFMRWRRKWQPTPVFLPGES